MQPGLQKLLHALFWLVSQLLGLPLVATASRALQGHACCAARPSVLRNYGDMDVLCLLLCRWPLGRYVGQPHRAVGEVQAERTPAAASSQQPGQARICRLGGVSVPWPPQRAQEQPSQRPPASQSGHFSCQRAPRRLPLLAREAAKSSTSIGIPHGLVGS